MDDQKTSGVLGCWTTSPDESVLFDRGLYGPEALRWITLHVGRDRYGRIPQMRQPRQVGANRDRRAQEPGSVIGEQQHYLCAVGQPMRHAAARASLLRLKRQARWRHRCRRAFCCGKQ